MGFVKKLTKIGNSYGVILPKEILKEVGIDPTKNCKISVQAGHITLAPDESEQNVDEKVVRSMLGFMSRYRSDLKKLASS